LPIENSKPAILCPSCNTEFKGVYCYRCGERQLDQKQRSLKYLFASLFESFTDLDGKLWRTLKLFILEPGKLSLLHHQGVRKNYLKPITLFLFISIIFFIFTPTTDFNLSLNDQLNLQPIYSEWLSSVIEKQLNTMGKSEKEIAVSYNLLSPVIAKTLFFINIPILSIGILLLNYKKKFVYLDHFIYSLYINSFILFLPLIIASLFYILGLFLPELPGIISTLMIIGVILTFLFLSQKNMYGNSNWVAAFKTLGLFIFIILTHIFIYRFIQFWATWWSLNFL
jgi:hypothetical protein